MVLTDPISDMITVIRNGLVSSKKEVVSSGSKLKAEILKVLKRENLIENFRTEENENKSQIIISLKYLNKEPAITNIRRISKPGRRVYVDKSHIPQFRRGRGFSLITTSKGLMTDKEAKKAEVGGEVIIEVW